MKDINKSIQDAIKQHLPEMAAKELKDFIEGANIAINENVELKKEAERKQELLEKIVEDNKKLSSNEERVLAEAIANEKLAIELEQKEIRQEVEMLKFKNSQLEIRVQDSKEFMLMLAKNPRAIEYMSYSNFESIPVAGQYGVEHHTKTKDVDTITEKVETKSDTPGPINKPTQ